MDNQHTLDLDTSPNFNSYMAGLAVMFNYNLDQGIPVDVDVASGSSIVSSVAKSLNDWSVCRYYGNVIAFVWTNPNDSSGRINHIVPLSDNALLAISKTGSCSFTIEIPARYLNLKAAGNK